ncbi:DedA family protein [Streptomyces goshikiensis]|uniref:DedA family protein n=1 Tax=Streptomyces goshikiensis TaxID=1942 RepID=UPI003652183B
MPLHILAAASWTLGPQAVNLLDAGSLLSAFGALGVAVVLFAETGLLVGFFLPGDSLLFTAGLLCVRGNHGPVHLSLPHVLCAAVAGALLGAQTGYLIGRRGGGALLARSRSRKLHEGAERAEGFLDRYLLPIVALVVLVSLTPLAVEMIRRHSDRTSNGSPH